MASSSLSQDDLASKLLHSVDARIAEAAKRVFSPAQPARVAFPSAFQDETALPLRLVGGQQSQPVRPPSGPPPTAGAAGAAAAFAEDTDRTQASSQKLERVRARNRAHARKARQRKKEHMGQLQRRADDLKDEHLRLKQAIHEKNTASILVGLFRTGDGEVRDDGDGKSDAGAAIDPRVELLLKRTADDIPDASKIPELPALNFPGQHGGKRTPGDMGVGQDATAPPPAQDQEDAEVGIDDALPGKGRASCSPAELHQIRRERNRLHAKRTRERRRIFIEEMEAVIKRLEDENTLLQGHLSKLNAEPALMAGGCAGLPPAPARELGTADAARGCDRDPGHDAQPPPRGDFLHQIESLLAAAGSFQRPGAERELNAISCAESELTASTDHSDRNSSGEEDNHYRPGRPLAGARPLKKRQRRLAPQPSSAVPTSITTTSMSLG